MQVRLLALLVAVGGVTAVNGCGDSTGIRAQFENKETKPTVYALNGTSSSLPSAILVRTAEAQRVDATFNFDLAFDLNAAGEVLVYPIRTVLAQFVQGKRVGLLQSAKTFDAATEAPTSGYVYDSVMVVPLGKTVFVDIVEPTCSAFSILGQNIRAKFVIDSVKTDRRAMYLHMLSNQNCGFKSLVQGEPKD